MHRWVFVCYLTWFWPGKLPCTFWFFEYPNTNDTFWWVLLLTSKKAWIAFGLHMWVLAKFYPSCNFGILRSQPGEKKWKSGNGASRKGTVIAWSPSKVSIFHGFDDSLVETSAFLRLWFHVQGDRMSCSYLRLHFWHSSPNGQFQHLHRRHRSNPQARNSLGFK